MEVYGKITRLINLDLLKAVLVGYGFTTLRIVYFVAYFHPDTKLVNNEIGKNLK